MSFWRLVKEVHYIHQFCSISLLGVAPLRQEGVFQNFRIAPLQHTSKMLSETTAYSILNFWYVGTFCWDKISCSKNKFLENKSLFSEGLCSWNATLPTKTEEKKKQKQNTLNCRRSAGRSWIGGWEISTKKIGDEKRKGKTQASFEERILRNCLRLPCLWPLRFFETTWWLQKECNNEEQFFFHRIN